MIINRVFLLRELQYNLSKMKIREIVFFIALCHLFSSFTIDFTETKAFTEAIASGIEYQNYSMRFPSLLARNLRLYTNTYLIMILSE